MSGYRDKKTRFDGFNAQVLGVSVDSRFCQNAWAKSLGGLPFPLLSDLWPHGATHQKYGVFNEKDGLGERTTFVIDKIGKIVFIDENSRPQLPDMDKLLAALEKLK